MDPETLEDTDFMKTNCTAPQGQECIRTKQRIPKWSTYVPLQSRKTRKSLQNSKKAGLPKAWQLFTDQGSDSDVIDTRR